MQILAISTDDHAWEQPDTFTRRVSSKFRDDCPRVVRKNGVDTWVYAGEVVRALGTGAAAMLPDRGTVPTWQEVPKAAYDARARLGLMDQDGVAVEVLFPQAAGFGGGVLTRGATELRLECIRAYNDWLVEEWTTASPRFVGQCLVPMWDVKLAVEEVQRAYRRGHKGMVWTSAPQAFGFPHFNDRYWDPLWAAAQELDLPIALHIGSAMTTAGGSAWDGYTKFKRLAVQSVNAITSNVQVMGNLIFSGILDRFPKLKFISVESGLGWVPYLLETADHQYEAQHLWTEGMKMKPSEYFRRNCYVNFWFEASGIALRHMIGIDNILWEADFPHPTSTYPKSREAIRDGLAGVPAEEQKKLLQDNAMRVFNIRLGASDVPASCVLNA
jgi:predicted TIM-barrel fold metal-dependent hydrolase